MALKETLLSIFVLLIVPILLGHSLSILLSKDKNILAYYIYGTILLFAFFQFISVPLVCLEKPFHIVYNGVIVFIIVFSIVGIIVRIIKKEAIISETINIRVLNILCVIVMFAMCGYFLKQVYDYQHIDADDSRFVVNAVDMLETDLMFMSNPATGFSKEGYILGDLNKDIVAPWATYIAFLAKFTGVKVVTMAHTIMPLGLYVFAFSVWWVFAGKIIEKNTILQCMFVILMLLFAVYANHDTTHAIYSTLTKFMLRIWQGKATLAATGIPLLFICMFDFYKKQSIQNIIMILICNLGICFMSANGIVISIAIIGAFAFVYMILNKSILTFIKAIPLLIPNVLYMLLYFLIDKGGS